MSPFLKRFLISLWAEMKGCEVGDLVNCIGDLSNGLWACWVTLLGENAWAFEGSTNFSFGGAFWYWKDLVERYLEMETGLRADIVWFLIDIGHGL